MWERKGTGSDLCPADPGTHAFSTEVTSKQISVYFTEIRFVWMWAQTTVPPSKSNHPNQESIIKPAVLQTQEGITAQTSAAPGGRPLPAGRAPAGKATIRAV